MNQKHSLIVCFKKKSTAAHDLFHESFFNKVTNILSIRKNILNLRKDLDKMNHVIMRLQKKIYS